ncbi:hypothetical protein [Phreatobacter cathodiphilus]|uniref:Uncharacterized protein n=1 Tax=Phreatobacter cathodiphilus TaxID=1868589 RepID=A0A2S0NB15_9HYPH|nr:hypothetical protein [Phreatobacter cathodiphilus]AVO45342.1 hypothetical protein C6569_09880 [Phreatobacter cathodiphilus]
MASLWTSNIERDPRYRGAEEIVAAAGYQIAVGEGVIAVAHEETGESRRFRSRKEFLAFAEALAKGEPPPPAKRSAGIRNGQGFGERAARAPAPPPDEAASEADIARLQALCRTLTIERDAWKARAQIREESAANAPVDNGEKYRALKKFIAREFHPDQVRADGIERLVRTEVFKTIWAHIEELERSGR